MKLLAAFLLCTSWLAADSWTVTCNGDTVPNGGCAISATTMPQSRGFYNKLPNIGGSKFIYFVATPNGTGNTNNGSIYSSEFWEYDASARSMTFRAGNGATSIDGSAGSNRCDNPLEGGSPANTWNPRVGHPLAMLTYDPGSDKVYGTWQLCGGYYMGWTYQYNATAHTFGTAIAKAPRGTGDGTNNAAGTSFASMTWVSGQSKAVVCCDIGSSTRLFVEFDGSTYTDVTSSVTGADGLSCATSVHCPPAPLTATGQVSDGTNLWIYGGCTGSTPGSTGFPDACSGTNQNELYKYVVSTKVITKISPLGTKPVATYASFPFVAYSPSRGSILVYSDNDTLKEYIIATNTWSAPLTITGSGPNFGSGSVSLGNHMDGNTAGWDNSTSRFIMIFPGGCSGCGQNTSPAIYDVTLTGSPSTGGSNLPGLVTISGTALTN